MKRILLLAATAALMLTGCSSETSNTAAADGVSFDEVLSTRRSIRSYDASKTISESEVREILLATQDAPSWANDQPSKYYVAMSPEKIAIRKVMGSSVGEVLSLFTKRYALPLVLSFVIAAPIGYYISEQWLQNFAEHTPIYWWLFPVAFGENVPFASFPFRIPAR